MKKENPISVTNLVGVYELTGIASVWHERLTLDERNNFIIELWRDLGGKWSKVLSGNYRFENDQIILEAGQKQLIYTVRFFEKNNESKKIIIVPIGQEVTEELLNVFVKQDYPKNIICIADIFDNNNFNNSLTIGKTYIATEYVAGNGTVKIINDKNKTGTYPKELFE